MLSGLLLSVFLPMAGGVVFLLMSFFTHLKETKNGGGVDVRHPASKSVHMAALVILVVSAAVTLYTAWSFSGGVDLITFVDGISLGFRIDEMGRFFASFISIIWVLVLLYSFAYMPHDGDEERFFGLYLIVYGVLNGMDFAGNLLTVYVFFELLTITSFPMVLHNGTREAIMGALKYLFYSMCGAYAALFGVFAVYRYLGNGDFVPGGFALSGGLQGREQSILLIGVFVMIIGFGVKAGMFPLHAWLPTAHPVAPTPASAVLSGIIVKGGVLAVIRVVYYVIGADFLRGTWVQYTWMTLALLTVFMGSMLAYREDVLKKRLAYSSVSQLSYILFGMGCLSSTALMGAMLHTLFHAVIKTTLFMCAGAILLQSHKTKVSTMRGIGRQMPKTIWCWTLASLGLIGIPPTSGFISKWYLANGALESNIGIFAYLGPIILLISALLTAGYLLPVTMKGFFPGEDFEGRRGELEAPVMMLVPLFIMAAAVVLMGVLPNSFIEYISRICGMVL